MSLKLSRISIHGTFTGLSRTFDPPHFSRVQVGGKPRRLPQVRHWLSNRYVGLRPHELSPSMSPANIISANRYLFLSPNQQITSQCILLDSQLPAIPLTARHTYRQIDTASVSFSPSYSRLKVVIRVSKYVPVFIAPLVHHGRMRLRVL